MRRIYLAMATLSMIFCFTGIEKYASGKGHKNKGYSERSSSYSVIAKRVSVPFLDEGALENTMNLEVESVIPFPLKDIYYSYYVVGADEERGAMLNVQIVAAKKGNNRWLHEDIRYGWSGPPIPGCGYLRGYEPYEQIYNPKEMSVVVVDIGASITNIAIMKEENVEFTREVLVGGRQLTSQIEKTMMLSYKEAEEKKIAGDKAVFYLFEDFIFNYFIGDKQNGQFLWVNQTKRKNRQDILNRRLIST